MILLALLALATPAHSQETTTAFAPHIRAITTEDTGLRVLVQVPSGVRRVVLETSEDLARDEWKTVASQWADGEAGEMRFTLTSRGPLGFLRARADDSSVLPLPPLFYEGPSTFPPRLVEEINPWAPYPVFHLPLVTFHANSATPNAAQLQTFSINSNEPPPPIREVVESDIWRIDGRTVYYFNSSQGLQVIDLMDLDAPALQGTLRIAGAGEQLYLLPDSPVSEDRSLALLTSDTCSSTATTMVNIVSVRNGIPRPGSRSPVPGRLRESRLVGHVLYVVTDNWREFPQSRNSLIPDQSYWSPETIITSINLARPEAPVIGAPIVLAGSADAVHATDQRLFLAMTGVAVPSSDRRYRFRVAPGAHAVKIFDISDPSGAVREAGQVMTAGVVSDKFKIHQDGDVLSVVSLDSANNNQTILETWSLARPRRPKALGRLPIVSGENLHATRFDGTRLYVVTFRQIDPLWIIDLSDPAHPAIQGELQTPGWSTYLHPLGDRLLAMGLDGGLPTVSLYDVAQPAAPRLLSKVALVNGWSEANETEKAFQVLFDEGLVLVPVSGFRGTNRLQGIQLVDFNRSALTLRGLIDHRMNALRAAAVDHRLVSISASELLTVDASDRDQPLVRGRLLLQHVVDRVWVVGAHLLQLERANTAGAAESELRVTTQTAPGTALTRRPISGMPLLGESLHQGRLYLIQGAGQTAARNSTGAVVITPARLMLTVIDTTSLPELPLLAQTSIEATNYSGQNLVALWPNDHTLVWASAHFRHGVLPIIPYLNPTWTTFAAPASVNSLIAAQGFWYPRGFDSVQQRFFAFDVAPFEPQFVSDVSLPATNGASYGAMFASGDKVFVGRQTRTLVPRPIQPPPLNTNGGLIGIIRWLGPSQYLHQYELVVVDYAHASQPETRSPVTLPGQLSRVARNGALVFATGPHATDTNDATQHLHALAYDGFVASLVDSLPQTNITTGVLISDTGSVLVGESGSVGRSPRLVRWEVENDAKFHRRAQVALDQPATQLSRFNDLLVVTTSTGIELRDALDTARFRLLNRESPDCSWSLNLESADGSLASGLWLPQGVQGLRHVPSADPRRRAGLSR